MFKLFEVYFDLIYLSLMFGIGLRTLLEKGKVASCWPQWQLY